MSFVHYAYAGHFEKTEDGQFLAERSFRGARPIPRIPFGPDIVAWLTRVVPDEWLFWLEEGCLVFDRYGVGLEEIEVLGELVARTNCRLIADGYYEISLEDLRPHPRILRERGHASGMPSSG